MTINESVFRAYDIRGIYPNELNEEAVYGIAQAYAAFINPKTVALGRDVRISSPALYEAAKQGLIDHGVNVVDIGTVSTDVLYFAVANYGYDGGIMISASHNPKEYNGMKLVREKAIPISGDTGIKQIQASVVAGYAYQAPVPGQVSAKDVTDDYIAKCLSFVDLTKIKPLKVLANAMFGMALNYVQKMNLPIQLTMLNEKPDGTFPKGQPDPLQPQNRTETVELIKKNHPDLGAAWDADADRFFLFDENGRYIPAYYIIAFLSEYFCTSHPGSKIVRDARLTWAIDDKVRANGGSTIENKSGHSFFKERIRQEDAVFAGESSGHFYFKDFFYCDNGLVPFLLMLQIISERGKKVSDLFDNYFDDYPISGEINTKVAEQGQVAQILQNMEQHFSGQPGCKLDKTDGLSVEFADWRGNVRAAANEPLVRVNVEAKTQKNLDAGIEEVLKFIG